MLEEQHLWEVSRWQTNNQDMITQGSTFQKSQMVQASGAADGPLRAGPPGELLLQMVLVPHER